MKRVLLIWELGGEYGHISRFLPIALALRQRGYEPILLLRNLASTEQLLGGQQLICLQAPLWINEVNGLPPAASYAETLMRFGFLDAAGLLGICKAWRAQIERLAPDLILCDHAPTALLATRGMNIPRAMLGDSFAIPPDLTPLPAYHWWVGSPTQRLEDSEAKTLVTINTVLERLGQPPLTQLRELLQTEERFLCSTPTLDAYPQREAGASYWGSIVNLTQGASPVWPSYPGGKRIFAYLKPLDRRFEPTLAALNEVEASTLVHAPGVSGKIIKTYSSPRLTFSREPLRMAETLPHTDVVVCHAGRTADAALNYGKPLLLMPMQTEQLMSSKRAEQLEVALVVTTEQPAAQIKRALKRLLQEPAFANRASQHAATHPQPPQDMQIAAIIDRCETLMREASA